MSQAIKINPKYADAYNQRGISWHAKGNFDQAIADYTKVIELDSKFAKAYVNRGNTLMDKGLIDEAIVDFDSALKIDPDESYAYANRCVSWTKKEDFQRAMRDCNRSLEINPRFAEAYVFRGDVSDDTNDFDGAITDYSKAIEISPRYPLAYLNRAIARGDKRDFNGALADFAKAIEINPLYAEAYGARGLVLLSTGRDLEAETDFKKCFELKPALKPMIEQIANQVRQQRNLNVRQANNGVLEPVAVKKDLYPVDADASKEIDDALTRAVRESKRVMLIFGGNWCYDCHVLDQALHEGAAGKIVKESFLLVHVDIGEADKNLDLVRKYKIPLEKGVPAVVILNGSGGLLYSSSDGEFEAARKMMKKDLVAFLERWKTGH